MALVTPPSSPSPLPDVVDSPPLWPKREQAMVLPMARKMRAALRTTSRARAARAQDHVKMVRMTNQLASSGKCVRELCDSMSPAA